MEVDSGGILVCQVGMELGEGDVRGDVRALRAFSDEGARGFLKEGLREL